MSAAGPGRGAARPAAAAILLLAVTGGCQPERYFGPYALEVPTAIQERSAYRTFELPLDRGDQREHDNLEYCHENQAEREVPCRCDYRVLTVGEQELRVDYRLRHLSGEAVNATVWLGVTAADDAEPPDLLPDLPHVEPLAEHLHRLGPGEMTDDAFSEPELQQADLIFAQSRYPQCETEPDGSPAPLGWLLGVSLDDETEAAVAIELTVRVRPGD